MKEVLPDVPGVLFKLIRDFPAYAVGNDGSVFSRWKRHGNGRMGCTFTLGTTWHRLSPGHGQKGHLWVILCVRGKEFKRYIHHLVLEAFVGPRPIGMEACHFPDRCPRNNNAWNLRWGTKKDNHADMVRHGTRMDSRGERNGQAELTDEKVIEMRRLRSERGTKIKDLATMFDISLGHAKRILRRKCWKHI